jgi:hypothetical protein
VSFTFRPNSFGTVRYFSNQLARAFFKIRHHSLRNLLVCILALALAFRRFFVERSKLLRDRSELFFQRLYIAILSFFGTKKLLFLPRS